MSEPIKPRTNPDDFQDPLENYDPKVYSDPLEQALADETVAEVQSTPFATVAQETTIGEAVQRLADLHVACLLVENDGQLVGVFSDRDVLDKIALEYDALKSRPVSEVMTTQPVYVYDSDSAATVLTVMAVSGYRHVPVLGSDEKIVGIASPQRVTSFLQRFC